MSVCWLVRWSVNWPVGWSVHLLLFSWRLLSHSMLLSGHLLTFFFDLRQVSSFNNQHECDIRWLNRQEEEVENERTFRNRKKRKYTYLCVCVYICVYIRFCTKAKKRCFIGNVLTYNIHYIPREINLLSTLTPHTPTVKIHQCPVPTTTDRVHQCPVPRISARIHQCPFHRTIN